MWRLGVVSFLNSKPLICDLVREPRVRLTPDVPARLPEGLARGDFDAALLPIVDVIRSDGAYRIVSDACIGCDGETMTVRVFSQTPPDRIREIWVDGDSHTSVALATVLWEELYGRRITTRKIDARREPLDTLEAVLLIGDKVVDPSRAGFAYETDLGGAWRQHTGLPFVFAAWAAPREPSNGGDLNALRKLLCAARDRGVQRASEIASEEASAHGWPTSLAVRYLTRCLRFRMDARYIEGANLFARLCAKAGLAPTNAEIVWDAVADDALPAEVLRS